MIQFVLFLEIIFFYEHGLSKLLLKGCKSFQENGRALAFGYGVRDPERYGVISFDDLGQAKKIEEKQKRPNLIYAVVGLYFYPNDVINIAKDLKPSDRGEIEISSMIQHFLDQNRLDVEIMGRRYAWLDTGT